MSEVLDVLNIYKDLVHQADENVREFEKFLEDLGPLRDPGNTNLITKAVARLRWLFRRTDLLLLRSKLESSKSTITLYITMIHLRVEIEQLAAAKRQKKDKAQISELRHQV